MDFDHQQTRRLLTAGTLTFPVQFPTTGIVSIETGNFEMSPGDPVADQYVAVAEKPSLEHATKRIILAVDVAAIYYPAKSYEAGAEFEEGDWVFGPEFDVASISSLVGQDAARQESKLKGIVFVYRHAQVLTLCEVAKSAAQYHRREHADYSPCECEGYLS